MTVGIDYVLLEYSGMFQNIQFSNYVDNYYCFMFYLEYFFFHLSIFNLFQKFKTSTVIGGIKFNQDLFYGDLLTENNVT